MECPELEVLSGELTAEIAAHVAGCEPCALVTEMSRERVRARACARFEDLLAVRGALPAAAAAELEAHLATCVACRAIADTMAPIDLPKVATLPVVPVTTYAFGREVARGGMGRVVAAQDLRIGRPVAVKELLDSSPSTAARFEREARITARLQHPGIVPIYEIGTWPGGTPFYAMRLVEGKTLSAALAEADNRLALLPSVIAACEAVAFAHAHDVIHRDLKPSNIMVGAFGETVVIDWGLAKTLDEADDRDVGPYRSLPESDLTAVGEVMGTAAYMPPEQANAEPVDRRADVYSLGAILYHLLAGQAPYVGATSREIVEKVRTEPPAALPASAPRDLASIVSKALARKPADRYANAGELAAELQRFQTGRVVEAHDYSRGERMRRWARRHRAAVIGGSAALIALLVAGSIGLAGVLRERNHSNAITSSLIEEQGRQELLAGHFPQALAYFDAALQSGLDTPQLRFMFGRALTSIEPPTVTFECGGAIAGFAVKGDRVSAACGGSMHVWDRESGREVLVVQDERGLQWSPDGTRVLTFGKDVHLRAPDGKALFALGSRPKAARFTSDGRRVVVLYADMIVQVWDATNGVLLRRFGQSIDGITSARISEDGSVVAISTLAGSVTVYDTATGNQLAAFQGVAQVVNLKLSDDGRTVATCGAASRASVWRAGEPIWFIDDYRSTVRSCTVSPDGSRVVVGDSFEGTDIWDTATHRKVAALREPLWNPVFSSDGKLVLSGIPRPGREDLGD